jgi:tRNA modification GTPase
MNDTIFALSTGHIKSGVCVFRISGENAIYAIEQLTNIKTESVKHGYCNVAKIKDSNNNFIDKGIVIYFKGPKSFTGEDVVEFHCHGSLAVIKIINNHLSLLKGFRIAQRGELAKRAFYNNKMDLIEAEGLKDLIDAETEEQLKQAYLSSSGFVSEFYSSLRKDLLRILSLLEAYIDFPEEDIPESIFIEVNNKIEEIAKNIADHASDNNRGIAIKNGIKLAIIGAPNVGKSSLLNSIARREVAIVSDIAGTTRDLIESYVDIKGMPFTIVDTAGIRYSEDKIESIGIKKALDAEATADIKIYLFDKEHFNKKELAQDKNSIIVINKMDLYSSEQLEEIRACCKETIFISAKNNIGIEDLLSKVYEISLELFSLNQSIPITRERHKALLSQALLYLRQSKIYTDIELIAESIRQAAIAISSILGAIDTEEVLGEIFSTFCIGK